MPSDLHIDDLRCEWRTDPLGIDSSTPRLQWRVRSDRRGARIVAFQVLVAKKETDLANEEALLWDSGRIEGDESILHYAGSPLSSRDKVFWKVRAWDDHSEVTPWSPVARFEMGLLTKQDWEAQWIALPPNPGVRERVQSQAHRARWIEGQGPIKRRFFRRTFNLDKKSKVQGAHLLVHGDQEITVSLNGREILNLRDQSRPQLLTVGRHIHFGKNLLAVSVGHRHGNPRFLASLHVALRETAPLIVDTDGGWKTTDHAGAGWRNRQFDDHKWESVTYDAQKNPWKELPLPTFEPSPCPHLRRIFDLESDVKEARLYVTARGLYEARINGVKVGRALLTPGWTDYRKRIDYQTYDVSDAFRIGYNTLGLTLADGWHSGFVGPFGRNLYGDYPHALARLELLLVDGKRKEIVTDSDWRGSRSPITHADLQRGECYDARWESHGWSSPGFDDAQWQEVELEPLEDATSLRAQPTPPIEALEELSPITIKETRPGVFLFDFGQNIAGYARLNVQGPRAKRVVLRFAETVNDKGVLQVRSLRSALSVDEYVIAGRSKASHTPRFSYHGFRYVEVSEYPGTPTRESLSAVVIGTTLRRIGWVDSSNELLNRLMRNILWTQRANSLSVPTDCPQRDERLGWLADAGAFASTAATYMEVLPLYRKWLQDIRDAQSAQGGYPSFAPCVGDTWEEGSPGWADVAVTLPWVLYVAYEDRQTLQEHYSSLKRFVDWIQAENPDGIWERRVGHDLGDWLSLEETPKRLIATVCLARMSDIAAKIAHVVGEPDDETRWRQFRHRVEEAFVQRFVDDRGQVEGNTQTGYAMALIEGLIPEPLKPEAQARFIAMVERQGHVTTGFLGTLYLLPALGDAGRDDLAYDLLFRESYPSWGYMIAQGATTMWERWNGWECRVGIRSRMNSFNHTPLGSVGKWVFDNAVGIALDEQHPGGRHLFMSPRPHEKLQRCQGSLETPRGRVVSQWRVDGSTFFWHVEIPLSTEATLRFPVSSEATIRENSKAWTSSSIERGPDAPTLRVGSGSYDFEVLDESRERSGTDGDPAGLDEESSR